MRRRHCASLAVLMAVGATCTALLGCDSGQTVGATAADADLGEVGGVGASSDVGVPDPIRGGGDADVGLGTPGGTKDGGGVAAPDGQDAAHDAGTSADTDAGADAMADGDAGGPAECDPAAPDWCTCSGLGDGCIPGTRRCTEMAGGKPATQVCVVDAGTGCAVWGTPLACPGSACQAVSCDADTGMCAVTVVPDGTPCAAGGGCIVGGTCVGGTCVGAKPLDCSDGVDCTTDWCDPGSGCQHAPSDAACDDGDACNGSEVCDPAAGCVGGQGPGCDDGDPCTMDECTPQGGCVHGAVACDDDNACTKDGCQSGVGCVHASVDCDDGDACTQDGCDPSTGCVHWVDACDDGIDCTTDACHAPAGCVHEPSDAACDDGDACNGAETCDETSGCLAGIPLDCHDGSDCTEDSCDPTTGCVHAPVPGCCASAVDCDDASVCTEEECSGGSCVYAQVDCDDGVDCTVDSCDAQQGCVHVPDDAACDDGNACTGVESCDVAGGCQAGVALECDDGDACTVDACDAVAGCLHTAVECVDGDACTSDGCEAASGCVFEPVDCDDGNACTVDGCAPLSGCTHEPVDCDDGLDCTADSCDVQQGCVHAPDDAACDDGNPCNGVEQCDPASGCAPGGAPPCDDGNACTQDLCDAALGCYHAPVDCDDGIDCTGDLCFPTTGCIHGPQDAQCDDGDACNGAEVCDATLGCQPGAPLDCDDGIGCTEDGCAPQGGCTHLGDDSACDDGDACNGLETCDVLAGCVPGQSPQCDDANPCTDDSCDPAVGCKHSAVPGCCVTDADCDDADACTVDSCGSSGACAFTTVGCNDGVACTVDGCDPESGCVHTPDAAACEDGDACNGAEACDGAAGGCVAGVPLACDDGDPCTVDGCDPATGCTHAAVDCGDGVACTDDTCSGGVCVHTPNAGACDDGDACTSDLCDVSAGCAHQAVNCDDGLDCTVDSCDSAAGCVAVPNDAACDDGNACNGAEHCLVDSGCAPGAPLDCDDGNACTVDGCDPAAGCTHGLVQCADGNPCTADACDPATGKCVFQPLDGVACDDGDACTGPDLCSAGTCQAGPKALWQTKSDLGKPLCSGGVEWRAVVPAADGARLVGDAVWGDFCRHQVVVRGVGLGGVTKWTQYFGLTGVQLWTRAAAPLPGGGLLVAGTAQAMLLGARSDAFVLQVNDSGAAQGIAVLDDHDKLATLSLWDDAATAVLAAPDAVPGIAGAVAAVVGWTHMPGAGHDGWWFAVDGGGKIVASWTLGGQGTDEFLAAAARPAGAGMVVVGRTSQGGDDPVGWVVLVDASGGVESNVQLGAGYVPRAVAADAAGYVVAGSGPGGALWAARLGPALSVDWSRTWVAGGEALRALVLVDGDGIAVGGAPAGEAGAARLLRFDAASGAARVDRAYGAGDSRWWSVAAAPAGLWLAGSTDVQGENCSAWGCSTSLVPVGWAAGADAFGHLDCAAAGACASMTPLDCDDAQACTLDDCDAGQCANPATPVDTWCGGAASQCGGTPTCP